MKYIYFFLALTLSGMSHAQNELKPVKLLAAKLPAGIKYSGKIKEAVRYTDSLGDNIVVTTETGETPSKSAPNEARDAALFAYRYEMNGESVKLAWRVYDFIENCPLDIEANFVENTFKVTDLNKNGVAEVWLMYTTVCHGDVSPSTMKVIMYEGTQKFAMRGRNKVRITETSYDGGEYTFDLVFSNGPKEFRDYALNLWNSNLKPRWQK